MARIDYYYKPPTKYPRRIYVLYDAGQWSPRNLRPMGLMGRYPILSREMNVYDKEEVEGTYRLRYFQYEKWENLIMAEMRIEAGEHFIRELLTLSPHYKLRDEPKSYEEYLHIFLNPKPAKSKVKTKKSSKFIQLPLFNE